MNNLQKYNLEKAWNSYQNKMSQLEQQNRGHRSRISKTEFEQEYETRRLLTGSAKGIAQDLTSGSIVFTYREALNIARTLLNMDADMQELGFELSNNISGYAKQILELSPMAAHDFVSLAIDLGYFDSGEEFEGYTY